MDKCIDSLLSAKDDVEIIIVDDGSTDKTGKIADKYAIKYPSVVKVVHQPNGGHGEGINTGLKVATGKYFKIVDSDDWVDKRNLKSIIKLIKKIDSDMIVTNHVFTYKDKRPNKCIRFNNVFKRNQEITWNDTHRFKSNQYLSLHSVMFKKSILDKTKIKLPKHTYYEDNLFVYLPMINIKTIYYLDKDFYRYYIGRTNQSINMDCLIKHYKDQINIAKLMCNAYDLSKITNKKLRKAMIHMCDNMVTTAIVITRTARQKDYKQVYKDLWEYISNNNPYLYKQLKRWSISKLVSIPGSIGDYLCKKSYITVVKKLY